MLRTALAIAALLLFAPTTTEAQYAPDQLEQGVADAYACVEIDDDRSLTELAAALANSADPDRIALQQDAEAQGFSVGVAAVWSVDGGNVWAVASADPTLKDTCVVGVGETMGAPGWQYAYVGVLFR